MHHARCPTATPHSSNRGMPHHASRMRERAMPQLSTAKPCPRPQTTKAHAAATFHVAQACGAKATTLQMLPRSDDLERSSEPRTSESARARRSGRAIASPATMTVTPTPSAGASRMSPCPIDHFAMSAAEAEATHTFFRRPCTRNPYLSFIFPFLLTTFLQATCAHTSLHIPCECMHVICPPLLHTCMHLHICIHRLTACTSGALARVAVPPCPSWAGEETKPTPCPSWAGEETKVTSPINPDPRLAQPQTTPTT